MIRENSLLKRAHFEKEQFLKGLQAKEKEYINTITEMKVAVKNFIEKKERAESSYQEASKVIGEQSQS